MESYNSQLDTQTMGARATNLYYLQVRPSTNLETVATECLPLQLLISDLDNRTEQYLEPESQNKLDQELQLCIDACNTKNINCITRPDLLQEISKLQLRNLNYIEVASSSNIKDDSTKGDRSCIDALDQPENSGKIKKNLQPKNYVHIADRVVPPRAIAVLPTALQLRRNCVSPKRSLPARVRFGPLRGISQKISQTEIVEFISAAITSNTPIFLLKRNDGLVHHIDVSDKDKSNWLSLLPLGDQTTANVWLYEDDGELYGLTIKCIAPRIPLRLGYSKKYADEYHIPSHQPIFDLNSGIPLKLKQWWCYECNRAMGSAALLERHIDVHHKDEKQLQRSRYRCKYCSRTYCRLSTLKRHMLHFCTKKSEKVDTTIFSEPPDTRTEPVFYTAQNVDDSKVPSDESLQNYSNGLDFSTNLFDTDRMPNLDISGSSRSETEFNPYSVCEKDDNAVTNVEGFGNGDVKNSTYNNKNRSNKDDTILVTCPRCDNTIVKAKKRQHMRGCGLRKFECECGKIFNKKQGLAEHLHREHSDDLKSRTMEDVATAQSNEAEYKCEECKLTFKRRGMLVNHLWRVHHASPASVPLERRVRHYPCVACPKIYRAAAKRDQHVRHHHPGTDLIRAAPIEGERRTFEPAACAACPRQYATRAKMLQHVRAHHPHLAPPVTKKSSKIADPKENLQVHEPTTTSQDNLPLFSI